MLSRPLYHRDGMHTPSDGQGYLTQTGLKTRYWEEAEILILGHIVSPVGTGVCNHRAQKIVRGGTTTQKPPDQLVPVRGRNI